MNIEAVASGGDPGDGGGSNADYIYYSGSGGGGAGATLKYSGNALIVNIASGKVTLTSSEGDNIVLNKGGTGDNYTSGSTGNGGTGGTKSSTNNNNSFTDIIIASGHAGNSPKAGYKSGLVSPVAPSGGAAGINYSIYGIGKDGRKGNSISGVTTSNQSVKVTFVLAS